MSENCMPFNTRKISADSTQISVAVLLYSNTSQFVLLPAVFHLFSMPATRLSAHSIFFVNGQKSFTGNIAKIMLHHNII